MERGTCEIGCPKELNTSCEFRRGDSGDGVVGRKACGWNCDVLGLC